MATSKDNRDHYEVLHVSRDAPPEVIRSTYRTLMQKLRNHPDLGGDTETAAIINEAYSVLSDVERRAEYDAQLDIMKQIAQGVPKEPSVDEPIVTPARVLNPFRGCVFCGSPHEYGESIDVDACCRTCSSPLSVAKNERFEAACQRAVARIDKNQPITFYTHWPQSKGFSGETKDISLTGLRLKSRYELKQGQHIKIVSDVLEAVANVTYCAIEPQGWKTAYVAGVSFTTLRFVRSVGGFVSKKV